MTTMMTDLDLDRARRDFAAAEPTGQCPRDAGQIVDVSWAAGEDFVYAVACDQSDGSVTVTAYRWSQTDDTHEPWNGRTGAGRKIGSWTIDA